MLLFRGRPFLWHTSHLPPLPSLPSMSSPTIDIPSIDDPSAVISMSVLSNHLLVTLTRNSVEVWFYGRSQFLVTRRNRQSSEAPYVGCVVTISCVFSIGDSGTTTTPDDYTPRIAILTDDWQVIVLSLHHLTTLSAYIHPTLEHGMPMWDSDHHCSIEHIDDHWVHSGVPLSISSQVEGVCSLNEATSSQCPSNLGMCASRSGIILAAIGGFLVKVGWNGSIVWRRHVYSFFSSRCSVPSLTNSIAVIGLSCSERYGSVAVCFSDGSAGFIGPVEGECPRYRQASEASRLSPSPSLPLSDGDEMGEIVEFCSGKPVKCRGLLFENKSNDSLAVIVSSNSSFQFVAVGYNTGAVSIFRSSLADASCLFTVPPPALLESVKCMEFEPEGTSLACTWDHGGVTVLSLSGSYLSSSEVFNADDDNDIGVTYSPSDRGIAAGGVRCLAWGVRGFRLLLSCRGHQRGSLISLSLIRVKRENTPGGSNLSASLRRSSSLSCADPDSFAIDYSEVYVLSDDRVYLLPNNALCTPLPNWVEIVAPDVYITANWPLMNAAISTARNHIAVSGTTGCAVFSMKTRRWRVFGDVNQERLIRATHLFWHDDALAIVSRLNTKNSMKYYDGSRKRSSVGNPVSEILFYPRDHLDSAALICRQLLASVPVSVDCCNNRITIFDEVGVISVYYIRSVKTKRTRLGNSSKLVSFVTTSIILDVVLRRRVTDYPALGLNMSSTNALSVMSALLVHCGRQLGGEICRIRSRSNSMHSDDECKQTVLEKVTESISEVEVANLAGDVMCDRLISVMQVSPTAASPLSDSAFMLHLSDGRVFSISCSSNEFDAIEVSSTSVATMWRSGNFMEKSSTNISNRGRSKDTSTSFQGRDHCWIYGRNGLEIIIVLRGGRRLVYTKDLALPFVAHITPIGFCLSQGVVAAITPHTFVNEDISFLPKFDFRTRFHSCMHWLLLRCLVNESHIMSAVAMATEWSHRRLFEHSLEILLHVVLEKRFVSISVDPLSLCVALLRQFPCFLKVVVSCVRKTDQAFWSRLFSETGSPCILFSECVHMSKFVTAMWLLPIIRAYESNSVTSVCCVVLHHVAMLSHCLNIAQEVHSFLMSSPELLSILVTRDDFCSSELNNFIELLGSNAQEPITASDLFYRSLRRSSAEFVVY